MNGFTLVMGLLHVVDVRPRVLANDGFQGGDGWSDIRAAARGVSRAGLMAGAAWANGFNLGGY